MTILYILHSSDLYGGATKSFLTLLRGLQTKGVVPIIVLPDRKGLFGKLNGLGIKTFAVPMRVNCYPCLRRWSDYIKFLPRLLYWRYLNHRAVNLLSRQFRNAPIDIIHTNVSVMDVGLQLSKRLGIKHVLHFREYGDKDFGLRYFPTKKFFMSDFRKSGSFSICITKDVAHHHAVDTDSRCRVIYDGVCKYKLLEKLPAKDNYFLYAGRIEPTKGLLQLLEAYKEYIRRVGDKNAMPLHVAGEFGSTPQYKSVISEFIDKNSLGSHVLFLGNCDDIQMIMSKAKAIVISSLFEGFGRCMPEAMFNGCLVIGYNTGGTKEQFDNGVEYIGREIGIRYENKEELVEALMNVTEKYVEYEPMIRDAMTTVNNLYAISSCVENTYGFYKEIIKTQTFR